MKRRRAKPRLRGTACIDGKRCIAIYDYKGYRYCAKHAADRMLADHVKAEEGQCRRCGSLGPLDWAHVIPRSYKALRWAYPDNSMALCRPCHAWQTYHPVEGEAFFVSCGFDMDELRRRAREDPPMDPLQVIAELPA